MIEYLLKVPAEKAFFVSQLLAELGIDYDVLTEIKTNEDSMIDEEQYFTDSDENN